MKNYLVVVTGCTEPSCEEVRDHDHAVERLVEDIKAREYTEAEDCSFFAQVENNELSVTPFVNSEIEEAIGNTD